MRSLSCSSDGLVSCIGTSAVLIFSVYCRMPAVYRVTPFDNLSARRMGSGNR
jgi:hypothetical protein